MSIGLDPPRSSRRGGRGRTAQPTVREVCLLGMSDRAKNQAWATGGRVRWLGRGYQIVAASPATAEPIDHGPAAAPPRRYLHLAPWEGNPETAT